MSSISSVKKRQKIDNNQDSSNTSLTNTNNNPSFYISPISPKIFIKKKYSIEISIKNKDNIKFLKQKSKKIPFSILLYNAGNDEIIDYKNSLIFHENDLFFDLTENSVIVTFTFLKYLPYLLKFRIFSSSIDCNEYFSQRFKLISSMLYISNDPGNIWYKEDLGGRSNCIKYNIKLIDDKNKIIKNRSVPVSLSLLYGSYEPVRNQNLLKIVSPNPVFIDSSGNLELSTRIEEVSKNHQRQCFRISINPDIKSDPSACDIAPIISDPIEVRSKRGKEKKVETNKITTHPNNDSGNIKKKKRTHESISIDRDISSVLHIVFNWAEEAMQFLSDMQWCIVDDEKEEGSKTKKCPYCKQIYDIYNESHNSDCQFEILLNKYLKIIAPLHIYKASTSIRQPLSSPLEDATLEGPSTQFDGFSDITKETNEDNLIKTTPLDTPTFSSSFNSSFPPNLERQNSDFPPNLERQISLTQLLRQPSFIQFEKTPSFFADDYQSITKNNDDLLMFDEYYRNDSSNLTLNPELSFPSIINNESLSLTKEENNIESIFIINTPFGIPCFGNTEKIIGFYKILQNNEKNSSLSFFPINTLQTNKRIDQTIETITSDFLKLIEKSDSRILTLDENNKDVASLKKTVLISLIEANNALKSEKIRFSDNFDPNLKK